MGTVKIQDSDLLLVVDVQNDFCPGGALPVPEGDQVVPVINRIAPLFTHGVLTQDWHPGDHISFASQHPGKNPFETIQLPYGPQVLWPDHCVQNTPGAGFHPHLNVPPARMILRKGYHRHLDSYSAFFENDSRTPTGLGGYVKEKGFDRIFITGLALDFCVFWSCMDGRRLGFIIYLVEDACRAIDQESSARKARDSMRVSGVRIVNSADLRS